MLSMSSWLADYLFAERLYPAALDVLRRLSKRGRPVVLRRRRRLSTAKGRAFGHPGSRRRTRAHLHAAQGTGLADVERRFLARHYVLVEDKLRIIAAIKAVWEGG